jgi:hypothetical protein
MQALAGSEATVQSTAIQSTAADDNAELEQLLRQLGVQTAEEGPSSAAISTPLQAMTLAAAEVAPAPASPVPPSSATSLPPGLLSELMCPITQEPMRDPVVAADGHTYERSAIEGGLIGVAGIQSSCFCKLMNCGLCCHGHAFSVC